MKREILMLVKKVIGHVSQDTLNSVSIYGCYEPKISEELKATIIKNRLNKTK